MIRPVAITIDLPVDDVRRARAFYARFLRRKVTRGRIALGDDIVLAIVDQQRWTPGPADIDYRRGITPRLELRVDDVADEINNAVAAGARVHRRLTPGADGVLHSAVNDAEPVTYAHVIDPFGHLWAFTTAIVRDRVEQGSGVKRVKYFYGRLMTVDDLTAEQQYWLDTQRRHNRLLHGWGVVTGLGVAVSAPNTVTVEPGLALDPLGREVHVSAPISVAVHAGRAPQLVVLSYWEREVDPVPVPVPVQDERHAEPSRIEEGASVTLAARADAESVAIGRITRAAKGWKIDRTFRPRKVRR